ncbi:MAG: FtsH protease activity modulator HflK [Chloroflexota bacterium]
MFEPGGQRQRPEVQVDEILRGIGSGINNVIQRLGGGGVKLVIIGVLALIVIVWLASGVYQVGPRGRAALQLFGAFQTIEGPGLHWYFPPPVGKRTIVDVEVTRNMELGFFTTSTGAVSDERGEALMITGDLNIVNVQMVVQYRITDLEKYLFRVDDPGEVLRGIGQGNPEGRTLKDATEAALRQVVGQRSIDDVLVTKREDAQSETHLLIQQILDEYQAGIQVLNVALQTVRPPDQVRAAFDDVVNARVDKESRINQAKAYEQDRLPRALGDAQQTVRSAEAFKAERIAKATGEADRFTSVLEEYEKSREVTRQRLYLEAMEGILPGVTKFILATDSSGNLLQFLPLTGEGGTP